VESNIISVSICHLGSIAKPFGDPPGEKFQIDFLSFRGHLAGVANFSQDARDFLGQFRKFMSSF
jgi:hypothetical protein